MASGVQVVKKILSRMPKSATVDQIQYEIYVHQKIQDGLDDIKAGRVVSHQEVMKRSKKWLKK